MKVEYINPFVSATKEVLETMAFTKVSWEKPALKKGNLTWGVVTGVIGLASDKLAGSMLISFDEKAILGIVSKMLQEEFKEMNKDVVDAVGELTNMISGGAKRQLAELGFPFNMATPLMIQGQNVEVTQLSKGPVLFIPFTTDCGKFVLEANLTER